MLPALFLGAGKRQVRFVSQFEQTGGQPAQTRVSGLPDDPRVTTVGRYLRETCIDEIPQFFNVLLGQMSVVGPRPSPTAENTACPPWRDARLSVRPGITDWASIWNPDEGALLQGSPDPDRDYLEKIRPEKIRLQLKYVRERSFWTDLKIIFQTLQALVRE